MLILDLWGISFHAVVVFGLGKNLLFKSILGRCARSLQDKKKCSNGFQSGKKNARRDTYPKVIKYKLAVNLGELLFRDNVFIWASKIIISNNSTQNSTDHST